MEIAGVISSSPHAPWLAALRSATCGKIILGIYRSEELSSPADDIWEHAMIKLLGERDSDDAQETMKRIIDTVAEDKSDALCCLAVAHTHLVGVHAKLWAEFDHLCQRQKSAKLLFLDPESDAAARREAAERNLGFPTISEIRDRLIYAKKMQARGINNLAVCLYGQDPSCFLMFNSKELVYHQYFLGGTGGTIPLLQVTNDEPLYEVGLNHFDVLWSTSKAYLCPPE
jgi:hypothetical protein